MNKYTTAECTINTYIKYIIHSGIDNASIVEDKHQIYRIEHISLPIESSKKRTIVYSLEEINTKNMRFINKSQLKKHFKLDLVGNILFKKEKL